jgi:hypothetical protein
VQSPRARGTKAKLHTHRGLSKVVRIGGPSQRECVCEMARAGGGKKEPVWDQSDRTAGRSGRNAVTVTIDIHLSDARTPTDEVHHTKYTSHRQSKRKEAHAPLMGSIVGMDQGHAFVRCKGQNLRVHAGMPGHLYLGVIRWGGGCGQCRRETARPLSTTPLHEK